VHGAIMNQHVQACEHMSSGCTRQHAIARICSAPLHRCPSLRLLTCVGNEILSAIGACYRKACLWFHTLVRIRVHQDQCDRTQNVCVYMREREREREKRSKRTREQECERAREKSRSSASEKEHASTQGRESTMWLVQMLCSLNK